MIPFPSRLREGSGAGLLSRPLTHPQRPFRMRDGEEC